MSWPIFALVLVAFFLTHTIPVRPKIKASLQSIFGPRGFTSAYSVLSLFMLGLLIVVARHAPFIELWPQTAWHRYAVFVGMFAVCLITAFAIGRSNPFSFGGIKNERYDPSHPGIVRFTRHPFLLVLSLWAGLHILPNGDVAHVILFGVFLVFSLLGRFIIDRRKMRQMGTAEWHALKARTEKVPLLTPYARGGGIILRFGAAIGVFLILLFLHEPLIGAYPLPFSSLNG